jgi:hypothetical protein
LIKECPFNSILKFALKRDALSFIRSILASRSMSDVGRQFMFAGVFKNWGAGIPRRPSNSNGAR